MAWFPEIATEGGLDFSRLNRGERTVVLAGALLLVDLFFFPWHRFPVGVVLLGGLGRVRSTALQSPHALQGTLAFLVTVAMVAQVVMSRFSNQKVNPALAKLQPAAGMAVVGLLAWKLAVATVYLSVGCYLGLVLAGFLAYGALTMAREPGSP